MTYSIFRVPPAAKHQHVGIVRHVDASIKLKALLSTKCSFTELLAWLYTLLFIAQHEQKVTCELQPSCQDFNDLKTTFEMSP